MPLVPGFIRHPGFPAIRADIQAHPADADAPGFLQPAEIPVAGRCIEAGLPWLVLAECPAGDGLFRAYVGALGAFAAPLLHGAAGRFKRGVGEHRHPPHPGAVVRGDEETDFCRSSQGRRDARPVYGKLPLRSFRRWPVLRTAREVPGRPARWRVFAAASAIWSRVRFTTS